MLHDTLGCRPVATKENLRFQKPLHTVLFVAIGESVWSVQWKIHTPYLIDDLTYNTLDIRYFASWVVRITVGVPEARFPPLNLGLMRISRSRFKQSKTLCSKHKFLLRGVL